MSLLSEDGGAVPGSVISRSPAVCTHGQDTLCEASVLGGHCTAGPGSVCNPF